MYFTGRESNSICREKVTTIHNYLGLVGLYPVDPAEVLAALLVIYVDDLRTVELSEENCWVIMHHISSGLGHLGVQIAAQKILPPKSQP
jgi:hypothetical protein